MMQLNVWLLFALVAISLRKSFANVIGIDIGTDFMKVALVAPKRPLEIVTNVASKRKTEMAIHFDRGERSFGSDAIVMLSRKPQQTFTKLVQLLGKKEDHPDVISYQSSELPPLAWNATRGGLSLILKDRGTEKQFFPEELMSMMLNHASDMTQSFGYTVHDAVLTVPQYWTAMERFALADAVELSSLSSLAFIDENTAAALQYSIDHPHDDPYTILFYNMGAASTQVSIVTFSQKIIKEKNVGQFKVRGKSWDTSLGGHWFDLQIADLLAERFNMKWGKGDVRNISKAMAKLRVQAKKVKEVLSANIEIPVTIESLHDGIDFTTLITRVEFEQHASSLFERVTNVIDTVVTAANITLSDIDVVELIGGSVRIPKVQDLISQYLKSVTIGTHLNGDETFALGAAFAGANISRAFHVRQVGMTDITPFAVDLHLKDAPSPAVSKDSLFTSLRQKLGGTESDKEKAEEILKSAERELSDGENLEFYKKVSLYNINALLNSRKTITLTHARDMRANLTYSEDNPYLPNGTQSMICSYNITGIEKFATDMIKEGLGIPKVTLKFSVDAFGIPQLLEAHAEVTFEKEITYEEEVEVEDETEAAPDSSKEKDNSTISEANDSADELKLESGDEKLDESKDDKESSIEKKKKPIHKSKKKIKVTKTKMITQSKKEKLAITRHFFYNEIRPLNIEEKKRSSEKLTTIEGDEKARHAKAAAKNDLESFILRVRSEAGYDAKDELITVSTEEQRDALVSLATELEEWLYDDGWDEEADIYRGKKLQLTKLADPIYLRMTEQKTRPAEVQKATLYFDKVRETTEKWRKSKPHITEEELADLLEKVDKAERWLADKKEAQSKLQPYEQPAFLSSDIEPQLKAVHTLVARLSKKPAPKVEKKKEEADSTETKESAADQSDSTSEKSNSDAADLDSEPDLKGSNDKDDSDDSDSENEAERQNDEL